MKKIKPSTPTATQTPSSQRSTPLGMALVFGWALFAGLAIHPVQGTPAPSGSSQSGIDLTEIFQADGTLDRLLNSSLADLRINGPSARRVGNLLYVRKTIDGMRFTGFPRGVDITDRKNLQTRQSRLTIELWLPAEIDFERPESAWLYIAQAGSRHLDQPNQGTVLKRALSRKLARAGIPAAIWYETDAYPSPAGNGVPEEGIARQLGYRGDGDLLHTGLTWMILKDPDRDPLDVQDLRYHFRFGIAQAYMLTATFVQRFVLNKTGERAREWTENLKTVLAGGSKRGTAIVTASGVDPRVRVVRFSGSQSGNTDGTGAWPRYLADWKECPGSRYEITSVFSAWSEEHAHVQPSYYDAYAMGRDPERYRNLFFLDIVGTHDWINPLGSHSSFWDARDGLVNGRPNRSEPRWKSRLIRRPNRNHGTDYVVAEHNGLPVPATHLLVWHTLRHLIQGTPLARIDLVDLDVSGTETWTATVRMTGALASEEREHYRLFVALSDDRDFRRCSAPVETSAHGACYDGLEDDNKEAEDRFIPITPVQVVRRGAYRILTFPVPSERSSFSQVPLVAGFVELHYEGRHKDKIVDDVWMHTRVAFRNEELFPPHTCP